MLPARDLALILVVVLAWGSNFSAMRLALDELPPLLFVALRFAILLPLIAFLPRPQVSWSAIAGVALLINCGQFGFLFSAMSAGLSAGMASLLLQMQAPLTILLAALVFKERVTLRQILGLAIALSGLALIASALGGNVPLLGLALVLCGALCWAGGNLILRRLPGVSMLALFAWASLLAWPPMLALSFAAEGTDGLQVIATLTLQGWAAVIYVAMISTVIGYALWGTLLSRHPAAQITPFALLIPVVGIATAALILGERITPREAIGALAILGGLAIAMTRSRSGNA